VSETPTLPNLADHLRRLLEAVQDACGMGRRRGLLAGPMALLMWICTRRMRKEIEAAAKQFAAMMERLLVLLEDFRAGKLTAPNAPEALTPSPLEGRLAPAPGVDPGVDPGGWGGGYCAAEGQASLPRPRQTAPVQRPQVQTETGAAKAPASQTPSLSLLRYAEREGPAEREGEVHPHRHPLIGGRQIRPGLLQSLFLNGASSERENCVYCVAIS
jgi:hypothetical protein